MTDDENEKRILDPSKTLIPSLWVTEGDEVCCTYYQSAEAAMQCAYGAEALGLGWRLDAYHAPVSDDTEQREWRLVVWRDVKSDALIGVRAGDPETP